MLNARLGYMLLLAQSPIYVGLGVPGSLAVPPAWEVMRELREVKPRLGSAACFKDSDPGLSQIALEPARGLLGRR